MDTEIRNEVLRIVKDLEIQDFIQKKAVVRFINSPFFLTVIAGIILTIVSGFMTNKITRAAEERQLFHTKLNTKIVTMNKFSGGIVRFLESSFDMRKREIWLALNQNNRNEPSLTYPDGRNFIETRNFYEKQLSEYLKVPHADALCVHAKAVFSNSDEKLIAAIDELDTTLDNYISNYDYDILYTSFENGTEQYEIIVQMMGNHINNLKNKEGI